MEKIIPIFLFILLILSAGCSGKIPTYDRDVWLYSIDPSGELNWNSCVDCLSMDIADSLIESNDGNYIIGGGGVSEKMPNSIIPEIIWISPKGDMLNKRYYGTKDDGWVTTLSKDSNDCFFMVCHSGKSFLLDQNGEPLHIIDINVTKPGWWLSSKTPNGYVAASRTEAFSVSDSGDLLWHTVYQQNSSSSGPPSSLIRNEKGNFVIAYSHSYKNEFNILLTELDDKGNIVGKGALNTGSEFNNIYFTKQIKNGNYDIIGNGSIISVDIYGKHPSVNQADYIVPNSVFCQSGDCYAEPITGKKSLFGKENNKIRLVKKKTDGKVSFDMYYNAGNFKDNPVALIETNNEGYAVLVRHETYE